MDVWVVRESAGYRWLLADGSGRQTALARAAGIVADEMTCRASAVRLSEAPGEAMLCVQEADGRWRWRLSAADGAPLAESAVSFADAPTCRDSALAMQRVLVSGGR
jgi:hypothetical protein